jgi:predicted RNA-binding Zn ribbon-like protein
VLVEHLPDVKQAIVDRAADGSVGCLAPARGATAAGRSGSRPSSGSLDARVVYRIFGAIARDRLPARQVLEALSGSLPHALGRLRLAWAGRGFAWGWADERRDLDWMLAPILRSAADLLSSIDLARVRQ